jgi:hypothetical protein
VLFFIFSLWFVQSGIARYKDTLTRTEKFQEIEKTKVKQYLNYTQYGTYGIRMLFVPAPVNVFFFNSGVIPDLTSYADSGERLKMYNPLKGKNLFHIKKFHFTDFSGFILVIGALLVLIYGFTAAITDPEYQRFLATVTSGGKVFFFTHLSRLLIVLFFLSALFLCAYLLTLLNGLSVPFDIHMLIFLMAALSALVFFYFLGALTGTMESRLAGITLMFALWFLFLFAVPATINSYISNKADDIMPIYELEMEKLKTIMKYEKRAIEEHGWFNKEKKDVDVERKLYESYMRNEYKKFQDLEERMQSDMKKNIDLFNKLSLILPNTQYISITDEISSRGYDSLIEFYTYVNKCKLEFVQYYSLKKFFSNHEKVQPFFKGDENIYRSRSRLPGVLWWGFVVTFFYIILLVWWNYARYRKRLCPHPGEPEEIEPARKLELNRGQYMTVKCARDFDLKKHLYNLFSGEHGHAYRDWFKDRVIVEDRDVVTPPHALDFLYLCRPCRIPGAVHVSDFIRFLSRLQGFTAQQEETIRAGTHVKPLLDKTFKAVKDHEKADVLMAVTRFTRRDMYLVDRITKDMPAGIFIRFKDWMESLTEEGAMVIYLAVYNELVVAPGKEESGYLEGEYWGRIVDSLKGE